MKIKWFLYMTNVIFFLVAISSNFLEKKVNNRYFDLKTHPAPCSSSYILRRPQNFAKSPPYFCLQYIQTKVRWRFRKILWQNIWTLYTKIQPYNHGNFLVRFRLRKISPMNLIEIFWPWILILSFFPGLRTRFVLKQILEKCYLAEVWWSIHWLLIDLT